MHVANFGVFASAERSLVFGINDFDETLPGPWEWDLKRLAASAAVACRLLDGDRALCEDSVRAAVRSYRKRMRELAFMGYRDVWYSRIGEQDILAGLPPDTSARAESIMARAKQSGSVHKLAKMTEIVDGGVRIVEQEPFIVRETHLPDGVPVMAVLLPTLDRYLESLPQERRTLLLRHRVVDVARKVVGVGSVGTRCWLLLMRGNGPEDLLFLQYKEAQPSVLAPYTRTPRWDCEGRRVVVGQRLIQGAPDIFLGWGINVEGVHFYMRQLSDMKGGYEFDPATVRVKDFPRYCRLCGWALALAHAKSGDPALIAGYLGKSDRLDEAVTRFALAYTRQNERDYEAFARAAKAKQIEVAETA
jgi:hypothetical protein